MGIAKLEMTKMFETSIELVSAGESLFITGKAGTGKSTLLNFIVSSELKKDRAVQVVAPTGVAALNVSGQTIHKLFAFRPDLSSALRDYRPPKILGELDLLVVDEISMARADLVDMMDRALQRARADKRPFGGIQLVLVGDLFQLPPVVSRQEGDFSGAGYATAFFFSSKAIQSLNYRTIELLEVFRQKDPDFIGLLNSVRDGIASEMDIDRLNTRLIDPSDNEDLSDYVTLTTTNKVADSINNQKLSEIGASIHVSYAAFGGDFEADTYKVDAELEFSEGAQVMMLVNQSNYVNGSIGRIETIVSRDGGGFAVSVRLIDSGDLATVTPYRWSVLRGRKAIHGFEYDEVGFFEQLPFKLAWAVTVHKSQGKTFDRVIFDRGREVFAEGQLYVALSRCRTFEGLRLAKPLKLRDVRTSSDVLRFSTQQHLEPNVLSASPMAFIGFVQTGGGDYSKLVEVSVVRVDGTERSVFSTLVNPLRDLADARVSGLNAQLVALAPTIEDFKPIFDLFLSGCVVVGPQVGRLADLMQWDKTVVGLDISDVGSGVGANITSEMTATARAFEAEKVFLTAPERKYRVSPYFSGSDDLQEGCYFLPRDEITSNEMESFLSGLDVRSREDKLVAAGAVGLPPGLLPGSFSLDSESIWFAERVRDSLKNSSMRDGQLREGERDVILEYCKGWGIQDGLDPISTADFRILLVPGLQVCLTGEPGRGEETEVLGKPALRKLMEKIGLVEVNSVTISKCDLVVAYNSSSMSGKAKRARDLGKPVLSAEEFVSLASGQ